MQKVVVLSLLVMLLLALPVTALAGGTALDRTIRAGWTCVPIEGDFHCFDPGDGRSHNTSTINVKVFDGDGIFLGTEQLWRVDLYAGQPCPQDELLDLRPELPYIACHRYSH